ncbi:MAG: hypothetical protein V4540_08885 [Pseudomonadota bacterium]
MPALLPVMGGLSLTVAAIQVMAARNDFRPALYVPGCPPHPLTFICGVLDLLGMSS